LRLNNSSMLLYAVTPPQQSDGYPLLYQVEEAIKAGVTCLQLREKNLAYNELLKLGREIKGITDRYQIPFIINDKAELAMECHADGVHVGQQDMEAGEVRRKIGKDKILGVSVQTVQQAVRAVQSGADYLGVGGVFPSSTKTDAQTVSHDTLRAICNTVSIPVIAIGGINQRNILALAGSGIDGIAVVSAIFASKNIYPAVKEMYALSELVVTG